MNVKKIMNGSFFKYLLIGTLMFFVDFGGYTALIIYFSVNPLIVHPISVFLASTIKFFLNSKLTFKNKIIGRKLRKITTLTVQYLLSLIVLIIYIIFTEILLVIILNFISNVYISKIIVVIIGVFINYFLDKYMTFNKKIKEIFMFKITKIYRKIKR